MSSQPRLLIKAGTSLSSLKPIQVNSSSGVELKSDEWEGLVQVRIAEFLGPEDGSGGTKSLPEDGYFDADNRKGVSWSIQVHGRFLKEQSADDVMWGNVWQTPLRDYLPYGTSAGLRFVQVVDPDLRHDLYADKPWALSPLVATMQFLSAATVAADKPLPPPPSGPIDDDASALAPDAGLEGAPAKRKKYMSNAAHRQAITLDKTKVLTSDFANGYISFKNLSLRLPMGLEWKLQSYWNGEPVTFVCRNRDGSKEFFFVTFEIVVKGKGADVEHHPDEIKKHDKESEEEEISSDVD